MWIDSEEKDVKGMAKVGKVLWKCYWSQYTSYVMYNVTKILTKQQNDHNSTYSLTFEIIFR